MSETKKMMKIREVTKRFGVTRSTLHGYDKMGSLSPSEKKGEGGYWYYNKEDLRKLVLIQLLMEAGYSRKEIKEILEKKEDLSEVFLNAAKR